MLGNTLGDRIVATPLFGYSMVALDGRIITTTQGDDSTLAILVDGAAEPVRLGPSVVSGPAFFDMTAMKRTIADGEVPQSMRNFALPVLGADGAWLVIHSESEVRKYAPDGTLVWSTTLTGSDVDAARADFFRRNAAPDMPPFSIASLTLVDDAEEVAGNLWLLMHGVADSPAVIRVLDGTSGVELGRIAADVTTPATRLAVDRKNDRLYLALNDVATVLSLTLTPVAR
jgi:hypothetical protein